MGYMGSPSPKSGLYFLYDYQDHFPGQHAIRHLSIHFRWWNIPESSRSRKSDFFRDHSSPFQQCFARALFRLHQPKWAIGALGRMFFLYRPIACGQNPYYGNDGTGKCLGFLATRNGLGCCSNLYPPFRVNSKITITTNEYNQSSELVLF